MQCTVLVFAQLVENVGTDRLALDLATGSTVADALDAITARHPAIADMRPVIAVAVNERYCNAATVLNDGDTLALIPPVSGG